LNYIECCFIDFLFSLACVSVCACVFCLIALLLNKLKKSVIFGWSVSIFFKLRGITIRAFNYSDWLDKSHLPKRSCSFIDRLKVCLYRTRLRMRLGGVRKGMALIKQTKVVYTERESERETRLWFVLFRPTPPNRGRVLCKQNLIVRQWKPYYVLRLVYSILCSKVS